MMPMQEESTDPEAAETTPDAETPAEDTSEQTPHVKFCFTALGDDKFQVYKDLDEGEDGIDSDPSMSPGRPVSNDKIEETHDGLESALKALVKLVKANPVGGDEGTGFQAGYSAEQGGGY